ncbi:MAG: hypothetical protein JOZ52_08790 [Acidobacteria bacterium]|nr:hypothetical protein [Acidobacteriota bacterium]
MKKGQLALSGITARGVSTAKAGANAVATREAAAGLLSAAPQIAAPENGTDENDAQPDAAVRRLRRGMSLDYSYTIFNAKLARGSSLPQLQTQYRLFQNGQEILTGQAEPFDAAGQTNLKQLTARGQLPITENLAPGEYTLQIIVTDKLGKEKHNTATQWVEFEIQ